MPVIRSSTAVMFMDHTVFMGSIYGVVLIARIAVDATTIDFSC